MSVDIRLRSQQRLQLSLRKPFPSKQLSTAKPLFSGAPRTVTNGTARPGISRGTLKVGHLENIPVFIHGLATAQPATENVDTKGVDTIVVVRGLTELQRGLAAEDFPPGASRRDS